MNHGISNRIRFYRIQKAEIEVSFQSGQSYNRGRSRNSIFTPANKTRTNGNENKSIIPRGIRWSKGNSTITKHNRRQASDPAYKMENRQLIGLPWKCEKRKVMHHQRSCNFCSVIFFHRLFPQRLVHPALEQRFN